MLVDSVNFIFNTCDMKIYIYIYILSIAERSSKVTAVASCQIHFKYILKFQSKSFENSSAHCLNANRESSGDSRSVTNYLLVFYKWSISS